MRFSFFIVFFVGILLSAKGQIMVQSNATALQLANKIVATSGTLGVGLSNALLTCDSLANGEFSGVSNLGISDGIVLSSGAVETDTPANYGLNGLPSILATNALGTPGDGMLNTLVTPNITYDACILEFDIQPVGNFVEFEYVFGSEEYPEFNCSAFNDVFGFFISGPGFATPTNIALVPSTTIPVSINSINDGSVTGAGCPINTALYVNNTDTFSTMDGFTTPLIAYANVTPGAVYHLKLAIADVADAILNSYVLLKANSLKSGSTDPISIAEVNVQNDCKVFPIPMYSSLQINNAKGKEYAFEMLDMNGRSHYSGLLKSTQKDCNISVDALPSGIYFLKMVRVEDNKLSIQKLVKH
jgi:hypothetical protein